MNGLPFLFSVLWGASVASAATPQIAAELFVRSDPILKTQLPNGNHPRITPDGAFVRVDWSELLKAVQDRVDEQLEPTPLHAVLLVNGDEFPTVAQQSFAIVPDTPGHQQDYYVEFRDPTNHVVHRSDLVLKESHNAQVVPAEAFHAQSVEHPFTIELPPSLHERGVDGSLTSTAVRLGYEKIVWVLAPDADPTIRDLIHAHGGNVDVLPELDEKGEPRAASIREAGTGNWLAVSLSPNNFFFKVDAAFNGNCFFWDDMFVSLATIPHHPWLARSTVEFWLAVQEMNGGVIPREVRKENLKSLWFPDVVRAGSPTLPNLEYTNPYLMHRVAAEIYRWDPSPENRDLLRRVTDSAEVYAHWIEDHRSFRDKNGEIVGFVTNGLGSGGDDSRGGRGNDHSPLAFRSGWTDLLAQMSDLWKAVEKNRRELGISQGVAEAHEKAARYDRLLNEEYWDPQRSFYLDLVTDARGELVPDARHVSIFGFWPLLSHSVGPEQLNTLAEAAMDPRRFGGSFPLPANSREIIPYDDVEEDGYWGKWSHWPSMVSAVIQGFAENGREALAAQLTVDFLHGMEVASKKTVYEFYGESRDLISDRTRLVARPGQHRNHQTRADFAGWGKVPPVHDLLAHVVGFEPQTDGRKVWHVYWPLRDGESFTLRNLVLDGQRIPKLKLMRHGSNYVVSGDRSSEIEVQVADFVLN